MMIITNLGSFYEFLLSRKNTLNSGVQSSLRDLENLQIREILEILSMKWPLVQGSTNSVNYKHSVLTNMGSL